MITWLLMLVLVIGGVAWLYRGNGAGQLERSPTALGLLEDLYARGEIPREVYMTKKQSLLG